MCERVFGWDEVTVFCATPLSVNWLSEVGLIAGREIKKNFRSIKGIILLVISLLGAGGVALLLAWIQKQDMAEFPEAEVQEGWHKALASKAWYGEGDLADYVSHSPKTLFLMMWATIWLTPLIMAIIGFDGIAGELQNRTVRYWNVRSRRWSYYLGKVLGLWAVVSMFTLMIHASVWGVSMIFGLAPATQIIKWGLRLYAVTVPIAGAWCGISTLVSSNFRVPILALLATCLVFFVLWMLKGIGLVMHDTMDVLIYLYPNTYDEWLLSPQPKRVLAGVAACIAFWAVTTGVGSFVFTKRDV